MTRRVIAAIILITQCGLAEAADVPASKRTPVARPAQRVVLVAHPIRDRYLVKLTDEAEALGRGVALADL